MIERRKYVRFIPHDNAYAAVGADYSIVGKINDISVGGMSIKYITEKDINQTHSQVDIFIRDKEFHLFKLPCKIVYESQLNAAEAARTSAGKLMRKICGIKIEPITQKHKKQLEEFLRVYTVGVIQNQISNI